MNKQTSLSKAVSAHVKAGDMLCFGFTHNRSHALVYEVARQFKDRAALSLVATGLLEYASILVAAGAINRLESAFAGNTYPAPSPSRLLQDLYAEDKGSDPDWTNLTMTLRLMAGAMGWPFVPVNSLYNSGLWNDANRARIVDPFSGKPQTVIAAIVPDVAFVHAPVADTAGNTVIQGPDAEETWAAFAARRVIVTADRVISPEEFRALGPRSGIPGHLVNAVVEAPYGAHPQAQFVWTEQEQVASYAEDYSFRKNLRRLSRDMDGMRAWVEDWVFGEDHESYLARLGEDRLNALVDAAENPVPATPTDPNEPASPEECAAVVGMRKAIESVRSSGKNNFFAGIGLSHIAAWGAEKMLRDEGADVAVIAENGMVGFHPLAGDPYLFNRPNAASSRFHSSFLRTLGVLAGPNARDCLSFLAAGQIDGAGNINSSRTSNNRLIVGSGGANDLANGASEIMVVMPLKKGRFMAEMPFTTSPIKHLYGVASDLCWMERDTSGQLEITGLVCVPGEQTATKAAIDLVTGGSIPLSPNFELIPPATKAEIALLRSFDPERAILG